MIKSKRYNPFRFSGALLIAALLFAFSGCAQTENAAALQTAPTAAASAAVPTSAPSAADIQSTLPLPTPIATTPPDTSAAVSETPFPSPPPVSHADAIGQAVCIAKRSANIRAGADKNSAVLGVLPAGETADVFSYEEGWVNVSYNGVTGFVSRDYLIARHKPDIDVPAGDWALILVNPTHLLSDGFNVTLADFEGGQVDARIYDICKAMFADAKEDGVSLKLVDAYRSFDRQNELYQKKVDSYIAKGFSREDAESEAATITARPNTSEHQTGLALDIVTPSYTKRDKGFANTDAFKWLSANAQDYGFTMRYNKDKQEYTKVIYEPWHWRFVGVKAAQAMKRSGQCFEEYTGALE